MSHAVIRSLLETRLAAWAAARSLPVAWENVPFQEPEGMYLRAHVLPARTDSIDLGGLHRVYTGVFQVSVVAPLNIGTGAAQGLGDEIAAHFPVNLPLTGSGLTLVITEPASAAPGLQNETRYSIPVSMQYRVDTN